MLVQSETKLIPALTIAERYDSNVFFIPGSHLEDYVTTVTPQLRIDHAGRVITGSLLTSLTGEYYVKNPGFNYIAPSAALNLSLDELIGRLDRKAKLKVSDNFTYTPKPLAFLGPETGSAVPDTFVRGIQTARANSLTNMAMANAAYQLTPVVTMQGNYTYSIMRFGTILVQPTAGAFFNTTFQNYSVGPQLQVSPLDVVSVNYQGSRADFGQTGVFSSSFTTQGGTLGWTRTLTPTLKADASAGLTQIGSGVNARITYLANATLEWKHEHGVAMLRYSRSVFPSFFVTPIPLVSDLITVSETYSIAQTLSVMGSLNYAKNAAATAQAVLSFESYSASLSLNYSITRTISAIASLTRSHFSQTFGQVETAFDRNLISLSLRGEWN